MAGPGLMLVAAILFGNAQAALPTNFTPTDYKLTVTIPSTVAVNSTLTAKATITLTCLQDDSTNLTLHWGSSLQPPTPADTDVSVVTAEDVVLSATTDYTVSKTDNETITITLTSTTTPFANGDEIKILVDYKITVNEDMKGVFLLEFPKSDGSNGSVLATNVWPTHARDILPCLDEPQLRSSWTLEINRPSEWSVFTSSFNFSKSKSDSTKTTDTFITGTTLLPTTALNFFISPSNSLVSSNYSRSNTSTTLSFWVTEDLAKDGTSLTNNKTFLADLYYQIEDLLETNFTLTKGVINIVLIPNLDTAFSGLGSVFIRQDQYYGSYSSAQSEGMFRTRVVPVLRQLLRQYAGFSTYPQTWSDAWITEAVGGYLEYVVLANLGLPFDFASDLEVADRQTALGLDTADSKPLQDPTVNVDSPAAVMMSVTDPLKRMKGAVILNMLDMSLPAGIILTTIKTLLRDNKGMPIDTPTFAEMINTTTYANANYLSNSTKSALENLSWWFNTSGYPVIDLTETTVGVPGSVGLTMIKFCGSPSCPSSLPNFTVSATVGSKTDPRYLITRQDFWVTNSSSAAVGSLDIASGDWVVTNMKAAGYYRATYNSTMWERAVAAVAEGLGEPPGRSQLIDDAFTLSAAGLLDYNTTISLVVAHLKESHHSNWYPVHSGLWDLRDKFWNTQMYPTFKKFIKALLKVVDQLLQSSFLDTYQKSKISSLFLDGMCEMDISNYRSYAAGNLTNLLRGDLPTTVDSSSYDAMVCCGAHHATSLSASTLWNTMTSFTASHYSKHFSAVALGCLANFTDISSLSWMMLTASDRYKSYITTTFMYMAEHHATNLTANLSSIAENLQAKLGAATVSSIILKAGKKLNESQANDLSSSLNTTSVDDVIKNTGGQVVSAVRIKTSWLSSYNTTLISAVQNNMADVFITSSATFTSTITLLPLLLVSFCLLAFNNC